MSKLEKCSDNWFMKFNEDKCRVLHFVIKDNNCNYSVNGNPLESIKVKRDLGTLVDEKL